MGSTFFILPFALGLILLPYTTHATQSPADANAKAKAKANPHAQDYAPAPSQGNVKGLTPTIEQACTGDHRVPCIITLNAQPGCKNADIKTLAFMTMNATRIQAETIAKWIDQKLNDQNNGEAIDQGLTDCSDMYNDAVTQLDDATEAFFRTDEFTDILNFLSAAMSDADTCLEGLNDQKVADVMGTHNQAFSQHCSVAMQVIYAYEDFQASHGQ